MLKSCVLKVSTLLMLLLSAVMVFVACGKIEFKVDFIVDDAVYATINTNGEGVLKMPNDPGKEGYEFDGWYWDKDSWNKPFTANSLLDAPLSSNMSVYAKWDKIHTHTYSEEWTSGETHHWYECECGAIKDETAHVYDREIISDEYIASVATCIQKATYYYSCECGAKGTETFENSEVLGHNYGEVTYTWSTDNTTCTATRVCSHDESHAETETVNATSEETQQQSCTDDELTKYTATFTNSAFATQTKENVKTKDALGHDYASATCTEPKTCKRNGCDHTDGEVLGHSFTNYVSKNDATCTANATETAKCERCDVTDTREIENSALGHTYSEEWSSNETKHWHKATCGHTSEVSDKAGHTLSDWIIDTQPTYETTGEKHKECTVCKKVLQTEVIPMLIKDEITFKTLNVDSDNNVYGKVANSQEAFSFINEVKVSGKATYVVALDIYGAQQVLSKTVTLNIGDNTFYVIETAGNDKRLFTVRIRRRPIYAVNFNTNGGTAVSSQLVEEDSLAQEPITTKRGYTLVGWNYDFNNPIIENKTIDASWTANTYKITYDTNGGDIEAKTADAVYDSEFTLKETTKRGYDFEGWYYGDNLVTTGVWDYDTDITLEAHWQATEYTIGYDLGGGVLNGNNPLKYTVEDSNIALVNPTKAGYIFAGWTGTDLTAPTLTVIIGANSIGNREYVANWTLDGYSITYNLNGGVNGEKNPSKYAVTSANIYLESAIRRGYVFDGWYTNADCTADAKITTITTGSIGDITLFAKWIPYVYNISYDLVGGEVSATNPTTYTIESEDIALNAPTKKGYTFAGWTGTDISDTAIDVTILNNSTGDRTYTAVWEIIDYSIIYNLNGGTNVSGNPEKYNTASATITLESATRRGYVFDGWYTNADCTADAKITTITTGSIGDITLFAKWIPATYSIKFNKNNSKATGTMDSQTMTYGSVGALTSNRFDLTGYTFKGWTTNSDGSGTLYANEQEVLNLSSEDDAIVNVYAKWEANTYSVTFDKNGGVNGTNSVSATYDSAMPTATAPTYTGYNFVGYYDADGVQYYDSEMQSVRNWDKAGNTTLYARWNGETFNVSFDRQGGTGGTTNVAATFNANMPTASSPSRTGYIFKGYFDGISGTGTQYYSASMNSLHKWDKSSAATLYAYWEARTYTVSFNYNNGNNGSVIATYDCEMPSISGAPTKTGYIFTGYYDSANNGTKYYNADLTSAKTWDKTSNTTLYAHWVGVDYSVRFDGNGNTSGRMDNQAFVYATAQNLKVNGFARTGYTFVGWNTKADGSGTSYNNFVSVNNLTTENNATVVLYAQWKINQYTATFINFNGEILYTVKLNYNEIPVYAGETPVKERTAEFSYIFNGWDKEIVAIFDDVVYTAQFASETNKYRIIWKNYDGSIIKTDTLLYGTEPNYNGDIPVKPSTQQYTYVFSGWNPTVKRVIKDIEYIAIYTQTINNYTVTFKNYDGSVLSCSTVEYGANAAYTAAIPQRPDENHKSYEFKGWSDSLKNITANKYVVAEYKVYDVHNFTYIDGTSKSIKVSEGMAIDDLIPTNTSTTVSGNIETSYEWKKRDNYEFFEIEKTRNVYNIVYSLNGGTNDTRNLSMIYGDENYRLYAATKDGYEFVSWCTDEDLTAEISFLDNITNNATLYAKYKPIAYSITYNLFAGYNSAKNPSEYTIEDEITLKDANKTGYTFKGWYTNAEMTKSISSISNRIGDIELYAKFSPNSYYYSFNDNIILTLKASGYQDIIIPMPCNEIVDPYSYSIMSNYISGSKNSPYSSLDPCFSGWYYDSSYTQKVNEPIAIIEDTTIYCHFNNTSSVQSMFYGYASHTYEDEDVNNQYRVPTLSNGHLTISFRIDCYLWIQNQGHCYSASFVIRNVTQNSQIFGKYWRAESGSRYRSGTVTVDVNPGDVIQCEAWSAGHDYSSYARVSYSVSGRMTAPITSGKSTSGYILYDDIISNPVANEKRGFEFVGWVDSNDNIVSGTKWNYLEDQTFIPLYKIKNYNINYILDGGVNSQNNPQNYSVNDTIALSSPTKQGYSFEGWYLDENYNNKIESISNSVGNMTLYAKFIVNSYNLSLDPLGGYFAPKIEFISDDTVILTKYLRGDESIEKYYPNEKCGFIFGGWYCDANFENIFNFNKTITENTKLYAKWIETSDNVINIETVTAPIEINVNGKNELIYQFIPCCDATITITSTSNFDLVGSLYDGNKNILISSDDIDDENLNFSYTYNICAGQIYYIGIKGNTVATVGTANIIIDWAGNSKLMGTTYTEKTINVVYGMDFTLPDYVEKEGYKFVGWFDDNNNKYESGVWNYLTNLTLHAVYEKIQ